MPNKPDKFDVKYWVIVDVKIKYCQDYFPYMRSQDIEQRENSPQGSFVVKILREKYLNIGSNVTTDNFFISAPLADLLFEKRQQSLQSREMDNFLNNLSGVVETGLFIDMAYACYVGKSDETVDILGNNE